MEGELKDNVKNWDDQFNRALSYFESIVDNREFVDSATTNLIKDFEQLEKDMKTQTLALEELLSMSELEEKNLENIIDKRIMERSTKTRRSGFSGKTADLWRKVQSMVKEKEDPKDELVVEAVRYSRKDHISKKDIEVPVRNTICKHVYDRDTLELYINNCKRARKLCQCPVPSCKNKKRLDMSDMEPYPDFFNFLTD